MKPRIVRILLSRHRVRWVILVDEYMLGFKQQRQFKSFATACFLAGCFHASPFGVPHAPPE